MIESNENGNENENEREVCGELCVHEDKVCLARESMPPEGKMASIAELFKVFGDSTRIKILYTLKKTELCVCDIAASLAMTQPAISYQLKILKQAGLVRSRRDGKTIYYALSDDHVDIIIGMAKEHIEE